MAFVILFCLYFFPTLIAISRGHINRDPIGLTNLFFGWTGLGWVICLIWAFTYQARA